MKPNLKHSKLKLRESRAGFTMAEVLIVIAILGVLAAVAIPGILTIQRNLEMMRLDESARTIYVAAQNRMSELKTSGKIGILGSGSARIEHQSFIEDFPSPPLDWTQGAYYAFSTEDAVMGDFFPAGSIDTSFYDGNFVIEYDDLTGMVYGVFYADEAFVYAPAGAALPRIDRDARMSHAPKLGYYGGADIAPRSLEILDLENNFAVINDEQSLRAEVTVDPSDPGLTAQKYTLMVEGPTADGGVSQRQYVLKSAGAPAAGAGLPVNITYNLPHAGMGKYTIILDSPIRIQGESLRFKSLFAGDGENAAIVPGSDVKVTLRAEGANALPASVSKTDNSLFAKVSDAAGADGVTRKTALIGNARHLQNLDPETGFGTNAVSGQANFKTAGIGAAELVGDIDWAAYKTLPGMPNNIVFSSIEAFNNTNDVQPLAMLVRFDGNGNTILGLDAPLFGTIDQAPGVQKSVSDLRLVNPKIISSGTYAGALTEYAASAVVTNCSVYAEAETRNGVTAIFADTAYIRSTGNNSIVGGLAGVFSGGSAENCFAALTKIEGLSISLAGGFAGSNGATLNRCYANTGVWSASANNGQGGWLPGSGLMVSGGAGPAAKSVGGFYGDGAGMYSNCYASGVIRFDFDSGSHYVAGFGGRQTANAPVFSNCYSVTDFEMTGGNAPQSISGFTNANPSTASQNYFYLKNTMADGNQAGARTYDEMTRPPAGATGLFSGNTAWTLANAASTFEYGRPAGSIYPFPRLANLNHYSDWPDEQEEVTIHGLYYYEKYIDSSGDISYGFYATFEDGTAQIDTLQSGLAVTEDGYAVVADMSAPDSIDVNATGKVFVSGASRTVETTTGTDSAVPAQTVTLNGTQVKCFFLDPSKTVISGMSATVQGINIHTLERLNAYYLTLTVNPAGTTDEPVFFFNPCFAKTAVNPADPLATGPAPAAPADTEIRTARQLTQLGRLCGFVDADTYTDGILWETRRYAQTRNIDFSAYTAAALSFKPIGASATTANGFRGIYNGNTHIIVGPDITEMVPAVVHQAMGLFGMISSGAQISNVVLTAAAGGGFVAPQAPAFSAIGVFAGYNNLGTITNCAVSGYTIDTSKDTTAGNSAVTSDSVGGFIGLNYSVTSAGSAIIGCSASNGNFAKGTTGGALQLAATGSVAYGYAGGFVGLSNGTIRNCYAEASFPVAAPRYQFVGGFAGDTATATTYSYCASLLSTGQYLGFSAYGTAGVGTVAFNNTNLSAVADMAANDPGASWGTAVDANTHPYETSLMNKDYRLPAIVKNSAGDFVHYGNWPEPVGIVQLSPGESHSLAIDNQGQLYGWGYNPDGETGNGTYTPDVTTVSPSVNPAGVQFRSIDAGRFHNLAIDDSGNLYSWGYNAGYYRLGLGVFGSANTPQRITIAGNPVFTQIAAGDVGSAALDNEGNVWTWGYGAAGFNGQGNTLDQLTPTKVTAFGGQTPSFVQIAVNDGYDNASILALDSNGNIWGWGANDYGNLSSGNGTDWLSPTLIYSVSGGFTYKSHASVANVSGVRMVSVDVGWGTGGCIDENGSLYSWGSNLQEDMGLGFNEGAYYTPRCIYDAVTGVSAAANSQIPSGRKIVFYKMAVFSGIAIDDLGDVYVWGGSDYGGKLGIGDPDTRNYPTKIYDSATGSFLYGSASLPAGTKVMAYGGRYHVFLLAETGDVFFTGLNDHYELGSGVIDGSHLTYQCIANLPAIPNTVWTDYLAGMHTLWPGYLSGMGAFAAAALALPEDALPTDGEPDSEAAQREIPEEQATAGSSPGAPSGEPDSGAAGGSADVPYGSDENTAGGATDIPGDADGGSGGGPGTTQDGLPEASGAQGAPPAVLPDTAERTSGRRAARRRWPF